MTDLKQGDRVVYIGFDLSRNGHPGKVVTARPHGINVDFDDSGPYWCFSCNLVKEEKYSLMRLAGKI